MSRRQRRRVEKRRRHVGDQRGHLGRSIATGAGVTVGATLLMGGAAQAACTCTVDSLSDPTDPGHTTLRDAITSANLPANAYSTITFAAGLTGQITLNGTQLPSITNSTVIQGPGGGQIEVDGDNASRIFEVSATDVTISGLTVQDGSSDYGGGIYLQAGHLTVANSVVTGNEAVPGDGGGLYVHTGTLTVDSSTLAYNYAQHFGGGIGTNAALAIHAGTTTVTDSTLSGNTALSYGGGAYLNYQSQANIDNSTLYGNYAGGRGGGVYHAGRNGGPGLVLTGSTVTYNYGQNAGGGIAGGGVVGYTQPAIRDSIVDDNEIGAGFDGADVYAPGDSMDVGFSLIGSPDADTTLHTTAPNLIGFDPQLGPLADNGGPTETRKPVATSLVVDAGSAFGLTSDQRGQGRPFDAPTIPSLTGGDSSDIGAVELQAADVPPAPPVQSGPPTPPAASKQKCKKKKHKRSAESAKKKCKKKKKKK
jgi:hypothetical protein